MLHVRLITDPFDLGSYSEHAPEQLIPFLQEQFPEWPPTARLYKEHVSQDCDVTPLCEADLERLTDDNLSYVVVYPGDPTTLLIIAIAVFVVATVALLVLMPKPPGTLGQNQHSESSTNSIGSRVNKARPNDRIPDIFGKIEAIPELLTQPLLVFDANKEFEYCYMAVGRGEYDINPDLVFDGKTPLDRMAGAAADFYGPFTRPGNGDPIVEIGGGIGYPLKNVIRVNEVNGQELKPPNANQMTGQGNIKFVGPASIVANPASDIDFTKRFDTGDSLAVTNAAFGGVAVFNATSQVCRFYSDKRIEFETFDPTTLYGPGQELVIYNGYVSGSDGSGGMAFCDVSGTYTIVSVDAGTKIIQLA
jgi:hypothetical protein